MSPESIQVCVVGGWSPLQPLLTDPQVSTAFRPRVSLSQKPVHPCGLIPQVTLQCLYLTHPLFQDAWTHPEATLWGCLSFRILTEKLGKSRGSLD